MQKRVSSGIIPYRETRKNRQYLLLKSRTGDWEFPKGGLETDEELQEAALRETNEETELSDVTILDGFREEYSYDFEIRGELIKKTVHLFIGKCKHPDVAISHEHSDMQWRNYHLAQNTLTHSAARKILKQAHIFIENQDI